MRTKKPKHSNKKANLYYEQEFQLEQDRLNNVDKKKIKEREKRIKQINKQKSKEEEKTAQTVRRTQTCGSDFRL